MVGHSIHIKIILAALICIIPSLLWAGESVDEKVYEIVGSEILSSAHEDQMVEDGLSGDVRIGLGGAILSRDTFKFGEYTGIDGDEAYAVGGFDLGYFRNSYYMDLIGENLGQDHRKIFLETGKIDSYKAFVEFDQIPHQESTANRTPFDGVGGATLSLKSGFAQAGTFTSLPLATSEDVDLELDRSTATFGFTKSFGKNELGLTYKRIEKNGLNSLAGVVGNHPANPRSMILPASVDQVVNELTASFSHQTDDSNVELQYFLSLL